MEVDCRDASSLESTSRSVSSSSLRDGNERFENILNFDEESVVHEDRVTSVWWAALVYRATGEVFDHVMS